MKALTIKQPWAWAIADGFKPTENRTHRVKYRGPLMIHAGLTLDTRATIVRHSRDAAIRLDELGGMLNFWNAEQLVPRRFHTPHPTLALGAVIGIARLVDVHFANNCCAPWGERDVYHWTLTDVTALPEPVPCKGRLGLWTPTTDVVTAVEAQLTGAAS